MTVLKSIWNTIRLLLWHMQCWFASLAMISQIFLIAEFIRLISMKIAFGMVSTLHWYQGNSAKSKRRYFCMSINFFNSKIFGVTEDFQRAYIVYTYFLRNASLLNSMYNSQRYLGQNVISTYFKDVRILFVLRVHRKDYSSAEQLYRNLNSCDPPKYPGKIGN